jgi:hypothetical protein
MTVRRHDADHLTSGQVAAMIDRRLRGAERTAVISHLSACVECRHDLAETQRALKAVSIDRRPTRRWTIVVAGVAAALVIAVPLALRSPSLRDLGDSAAATRAGSAPPVDAVTPLAALTPAEGADLSTGRQLVWRSAGSKASYIVTVQDTSGSMVWRSSLADTTVAIPSSVLLHAGHRYFWSVDARLADGGSTNTIPHVFTVR